MKISAYTNSEEVQNAMLLVPDERWNDLLDCAYRAMYCNRMPDAESRMAQGSSLAKARQAAT